jgi:hypothetical protein
LGFTSEASSNPSPAVVSFLYASSVPTSRGSNPPRLLLRLLVRDLDRDHDERRRRPIESTLRERERDG